MISLFTDLTLVIILSLVNGFFSMSELALMSANRGRLAARAAKGEKGAISAIGLVENSAGFLATVQIGITLIGIVAGVFGGATLAANVASIFKAWGMEDEIANSFAFIGVVTAITYLSLVLGELIPKQIALSHPETVAVLVSRPLSLLAKLCSPLVWILEKSSKVALSFLAFNVGQRNEVSVADIHHLISEGEKEGGIRSIEKDMAFRVFKLDDRPISAFMTSRTNVVWVDPHAPLLQLWNLALSVPHSYFPVAENSLDHVLGVVSAKDIWVAMSAGGTKTILTLMRPVIEVHENRNALEVIEEFKKSRRQVAVVFDEHGGISGIVTTHDLLEAIVGDLADFEGEEQSIVTRDDGSVLVDAIVDIHEICLHFNLEQASATLSDEYHSVGGVVFKVLGHIPRVGEKLTWSGLIFEVVDMDGHRIDKVLIAQSPK